MRTKRRLLFTCRPLVGHFEPLVPLAAAARAAGATVAFATGNPAVGWARHAGFAGFEAGPSDRFRDTWRPRFPEVASLVGEAQREFFFARIFADLELEPRARDLESIMAAWEPDLVVHEVAELAAPMVAAALGLPCVDVGFGALIPRTLFEAAGIAAAPHWRARGLAPDALAGVFRYLYIDPCPPMLQLPGIADVPRVQPMRPAVAEPDATARSTLLDGLPHPDTVYLTLGTIWNADLDVFRTAIEALRDEVNVVVTVGREHDPAVLGAQPPSVVVRSFIPQAEVLPWCDAVVCHGGSGTVLGALAHGCPLLVVPQGADQWSNAQQVCNAGAGRQLRREDLSVDSVRSEVMALLHEPRFVASARLIAAEIEAMPSPRDAFAAITTLL